MPSPILSENESRLVRAVMNEMTDLPSVDYSAVAKSVGITYAKNAKSAFKKIWEKMKATSEANDSENENEEGFEPKKPKTKKATAMKKVPAKKSIAKATTTGPKKAAESGSKAIAIKKQPSRKAKMQTKKEKAAAAMQAKIEENAEFDTNSVDENGEEHDREGEDEAMEEENDGNPRIPKGQTPFAVTEPIGHAEAETIKPIAAQPYSATTVEGDDSFYARANSPAPAVDDEHEAYIRGMSLEDWLRYKAEIGFTHDLVNA